MPLDIYADHITQTMTSYLSLHLSLGCIYPGLNISERKGIKRN